MQDAYVAVQEAVLTHLYITCNSSKNKYSYASQTLLVPQRRSLPRDDLKAIGAVERLARLEESVQFHHKSLVYIL